jgi:hypothetical protein
MYPQYNNNMIILKNKRKKCFAILWLKNYSDARKRLKSIIVNEIDWA